MNECMHACAIPDACVVQRHSHKYHMRSIDEGATMKCSSKTYRNARAAIPSGISLAQADREWYPNIMLCIA